MSNDAANVRVLEQALRDRGLDVTAHYYPGARHEVLNETNRDEVQTDIVRWLDALPQPDRRVRCGLLPRASTSSTPSCRQARKRSGSVIAAGSRLMPT